MLRPMSRSGCTSTRVRRKRRAMASSWAPETPVAMSSNTSLGTYRFSLADGGKKPLRPGGPELPPPPPADAPPPGLFVPVVFVIAVPVAFPGTPVLGGVPTVTRGPRGGCRWPVLRGGPSPRGGRLAILPPVRVYFDVVLRP